MVINKLRIKNFKCFSDIAFELGNLNLLAGSNGCGKSSVIQALLLLRQSFEQYGSLNMLSTYGKYVNLGLAGDILYDYAENENEKISFQTVDKTLLVSTPEAFFLFWVQKVCT